MGSRRYALLPRGLLEVVVYQLHQVGLLLRVRCQSQLRHLLVQLIRSLLVQLHFGYLLLLLRNMACTRECSVGGMFVSCRRLALVAVNGSDPGRLAEHVDDVPIYDTNIRTTGSFKHTIGEVA